MRGRIRQQSGNIKSRRGGHAGSGSICDDVNVLVAVTESRHEISATVAGDDVTHVLPRAVHDGLIAGLTRRGCRAVNRLRGDTREGIAQRRVVRKHIDDGLAGNGGGRAQVAGVYAVVLGGEVLGGNLHRVTVRLHAGFLGIGHDAHEVGQRDGRDAVSYTHLTLPTSDLV